MRSGPCGMSRPGRYRMGGSSSLAVGRYPVMSLACRLSSEGRLLLIAVDDAGRVWRWHASSGERVGEVLRVPGGVSGPATLLAGTAPGETIAVGRGERVHRWNADTGERLGDIAGATCATTVVLPDGRVVLATGYADGRITVS